MVLGVPKFETYYNEAYLTWMRTQPCGICGDDSEPHHVRKERWGAGMGKKPHHYVTVSRCRKHHDPQYDNWGLGAEFEIIDNLMKYIEYLKGK